MALTSHGHHIPGTSRSEFVPKDVVKCGGPKICPRCKSEVDSAISAVVRIVQANQSADFAYYRRGERVVIDEVTGSAIRIDRVPEEDMDIRPESVVNQITFHMRN